MSIASASRNNNVSVIKSFDDYKTWLKHEYKKAESEWHKHKDSLEASIYESRFEALHQAWFLIRDIEK